MRRSVTAGTLIGCATGAAVLAVTTAGAATSPPVQSTPAPAQSTTVACPASVQVTPALNTNLIADPGAESTSPFPVGYLPVASSNEMEPDCWTISTQSAAAGGILSALPYVPKTGTGVSTKPANPATTDPNKGSNIFWGGIGTGPTAADANVFSYATQTIDLSALPAAGQNFLLSAYLGGTTTQADTAQVNVAFENNAGTVLEPNVPFQVGPVTPAMRGNATSLIPESTTGVVPAGATKAVVTITMEQVGAGPADDDGMADSLNLTIGSSVTPVSTLIPLPYTFPAGSGGSLVNPLGIAAWHGQVYVSNTANNVVSQLEGANTATLAGSLQASGESGDHGPATKATLSQPSGLATDAEGDVYIADTEDNAIREVDTRGTITRVAGSGVAGSLGLGGPATRAELDSPQGVAVNSAGVVYVADSYNNRVVAIEPNGHLVGIAGTGTAGYAGDGHSATGAELSDPTGLAFDSQGNLYIADTANDVIRRVDARTGVITTVAGNYAADQSNDGLGGFSGDGGPATSARLYDPQGVAVDGAGDLFIADTFNHAIREVTPQGVISTVVNKAGANGATPAPGAETPGRATASPLDGPSAVAVDPSTNTVYIADTSNSKAAAVLGLAQSGSAPGPVAPQA